MLVGTLLLRSTPPGQVTLAAVLSGGGIERITASFSSSTRGLNGLLRSTSEAVLAPAA
jgi:hypothetical protein